MTPSDYQSDAAAPRPSLSQLDSGSLGDIANSVNLFRGDATFPLTLVSLPGANGLDLSVTAFYGSNVHSQVTTWNMEAPTDILGVGWSMPFEKIVVDGQTTGSNYDDTFYLVAEGSVLPLIRTGSRQGSITFQPKDYQFWEITYFPNPEQPELEMWEIVRDGSKYVYGLTGIQWGVRWNNWIGSTTNDSGERYPIAWNLVEVTNQWGDSISFAYENDDYAIGGNQSVKYTRSSRLKRITGTDRRTVAFNYRLKEDFERQLPHLPPLPGYPEAFQFQYEERFLDSIDVSNEYGEPLFTISFGYDFYNVAPDDANDHYRKRYLRSVTQETRDGSELPGFVFEYYSAADDSSPGSLKTITYPEGGKIVYAYERLRLESSSTHKTIEPPAAGYAPRVWQGNNYTVVSWHNEVKGGVRLAVYTWNGTWDVWEDASLSDVHLSDLNVLPADGFFAVYFRNLATGGSHDVRLFRANEYRSGEWLAYRVDMGKEFTGNLAITSGADYVALTTAGSSALKIVQWDKTQRRWTVTGLETGYYVDQVALHGNKNFFFATYYDHDTSVLTIQQYYADANMSWSEGIRHTIHDVDSELQILPLEGRLSVNDWFAVATYVNAITDKLRCSVVTLWWEEDFGSYEYRVDPYEQSAGLHNPLFLSVAAGSTIASAQHLRRYDGEDFIRGDLLHNLNTSAQYAYAYGADTAIAAQQSGAEPYYTLLNYDPYQSKWTEELIGADGETADGSTLILPSISGDYRVVGHQISYRDSTSRWNPIFTLPANANLQTLQNRAPFFIAYEEKYTKNTYVLLLKDGAVAGEPLELADQRIHVTPGGPGKTLAGPTSFVTFEGDDFDQATVLHLYQIVDASLAKEQVSYPVSRLTIDDGYHTLDTYYKYDTETATFDPYGKVSQYTRVRVYRGDSDGAYGYTENTYFNGLDPNVIDYPPTDSFTNVKDFFSLFNGQIFTSATYDATGRKVAESTNYFYAYDQTPTGVNLAGAYTRLRKYVGAEACYLFDLDTTFVADLNNGTFTQGLRDAFGARGFTFSHDVVIDVEVESARWVIADRQSSKEYTVTGEQNVLKVYGNIEKVVEYDYNAKGQPARSTSYNVDSDGQPVQLVQEVRYGWEVYPEMAALNLLSPVAQQTSRNQTHDATTGISVTTYQKEWQSGGPIAGWAPHKTYVWDGEGSETFDFAAWSGSGEPPQGWLKTSETIAITSNGLPREVADIDQISSSTLYDQANRFAVARFSNASITADEASYYGFEEYESDQGWTIYPSSEALQDYITGGDSHTGTRRLALPGNPDVKVGLRKTFSPKDGSQKFILSCWVKTEQGFDPDPNLAGWEITYSGTTTEAGQAQQTISVPLPPTDGVWRYFHYTIDPAQLGVQSLQSITFSVYNQQDQKYLLVDDIGFAPFLGGFTASVFDNYDKLQTAGVDMLGGTRRLAYDHLQRPVAEISHERPKSLAAEYLWRQHGNGAFDPSDPNSGLSIAARTGGIFENFHHGDEWQRSWQASAGWSVIDRRLVYAGGQNGTMTLKDSGAYHNYGVRFKMTADEAIDQPIGIAIGSSIVVRWVDHNWELYDVKDNRVVDTCAQPTMDARDWLLIAGDHGVMFFADGRQVLQYTFSENISGTLELFTANKIAIDYIVVFTDPITTITYYDNSGQEIQSQALDDSATIVSADYPDALGRAAISTKPARFTNSLFEYRANFVRSIDWTTGVMTGEVATYYPDDEGYPYSRTRFDDTPLSRTVETGAPGKLLAIDLDVPEESRHTLLYRVAANIKDGFAEELPAGEYLITTTIDQDKVPTLQMTDKAGNVVAVRQGDPSAGADSYAETRFHYDIYGNPHTIKLPNALHYDVPDSDRFVIAMEHDFLGRLVKKDTPDASNPSRYVYDRAGRIRFMQDANGAEENYILYWTYDHIGRTVEEGTCSYAWDDARLKAHADDDTWLPAPGIWKKRYTYDGNGSDRNLIGRLAKVQVNNSGRTPQVDVEETFAYDAGGRVIQKTVRVPAYDGGSEHVSRYAYDNLGNTRQVIYDAENTASPFDVTYQFDHMGNVQTVAGAEVAQSPSVTYAEYRYAADGAVETETFNPGSSAELVRRYVYGSPGWLTQIQDPFFTESLDYTSNGYAGAAYYTGKIARESYTFRGIENPGQFTTSYSYRYAYDQLGRLEVAKSDIDDAWSLGVGDPLTYDSNGNAGRLKRGNDMNHYVYYPGSDRLKNTTNGSDEAYRYNANGNVTVATPRGITQIAYDRTSQMATALQVQANGGATTFSFQYDGGDKRVLKQQQDHSKLYILSAKGNPLVEKTKSGNAETADYFIYGPTGLIAVKKAGNVYNLLKDHENSTRAVFDGSGICGAYNYLPFGDFMGAHFESSGAGRITAYLYTGQELDDGVGLYNYNARFYDSYLGRFYSIDPAGQFASPYIYVGDDPIDFDDPTGAVSRWFIGSIIGGVLAVAAGVAISIFTAGAASLPGGALAAWGLTVLSGALVGAGAGSVSYGATHKNDFDVTEWGYSVGIGAIIGAIGGPLGRAAAGFGAYLAAGLARPAVSAAVAFGFETVAESGVGALDGFVTNGALNAVNGQSFTDNAGLAAGIGAVGGLTGGLGGSLRRFSRIRAQKLTWRNILRGTDEPDQYRLLRKQDSSNIQEELGQVVEEETYTNSFGQKIPTGISKPTLADEVRSNFRITSYGTLNLFGY